jgi:hypothetical protein
MLFLRQGATHKVLIGPVVAVGDGFTPVTTLALNTADEAEALVHDSATVVDISAYTFAAVATANGYYVLTLQSGISGTVGHMTVLINDDSLCLPVKAEFTVLEEAVYDAFYAASATGVPAAGALEATAQSILTDTAVIGSTGQGLTSLATQASVNTIDDFLDTEIAAITAAVITNAAGVDIAADIIALKAETAAILVDTGTTLDAALAVVDANVDAILVDTGTTLQAEVDAIQAAVITNAAGVDIAADIIALKAETAAILADTDVIGAAGAGLTALATQTSVNTIDDFLDTEIAAILVDTGTTLDAKITSILSLLDDARAEPGQGAPAVNPDAMTKIDFLYKAWRNKHTQTATEYALYDDAGTTVDQKAAVSDDATMFTRAEVATGP